MTCQKVKHKTRDKAEIALRSVVQRFPDYPGQTYYCAFCHAYHFGRNAGQAKYRNKRLDKVGK